MRNFIAFMLACLSADAATLCVGPAATGDGSGSDWNNIRVMPNLTTANPVRGNTYYIQDGTYPGLAWRSTVGTARITFKKAIELDHGPSTGWDPSYGDGVADIASVSVDAPYVTLDGQVGQWASDWPGYVPYGIRIHGLYSVAKHLVRAYQSRFFELHHCEIFYDNTPFDVWAKGMRGVYIIQDGGTWDGSDKKSGVWLSHLWIRNIGNVDIYFASPINSAGVVERCFLEENGRGQVYSANNPSWGSSEHSNMINAGSRTMFRYNVFRKWRSTGALCLLQSELYSIEDVEIYGNIWTGPTGWNPLGGGALVGFTSSLQNKNVRVYNNTFVDIPDGGEILGGGNFEVASTFLQNNIFFNVRLVSTPSASLPNLRPIAVIGTPIRSYNYYGDVGMDIPDDFEIGVQVGGDPFVDRANRDYRLIEGTAASFTTGYNGIDFAGETRGADGVWDRGAYELDTREAGQVATPAFSPPAGEFYAPVSVTITNATLTVTIYYTVDGSDPTTNSTQFTTPISIASTTTLKALGVTNGFPESFIAVGTFTLSTPTVTTPTFSQPGGTYTNSVTITVTCATAGATIRYTTDGSTPTIGSTVYTAPLTLAVNTTLKAGGTLEGYTDSAVATAAYEIVSPSHGISPSRVDRLWADELRIR